MTKIPVYILAGGKSERFGSDKARALIGGRPLISRLADELAPIALSVTVVAGRAGEYEDLGLRTIADLNPGKGPLAGLHAALSDLSPGDWLLLAACDWIGIRSSWIEMLIERAGDEFDCVYFLDDRPQPLLALYRKSALALVENLLAEDRLAMQALIERLKGIAVAPPADWHSAKNVNRKSQLEGETGPQSD